MHRLDIAWDRAVLLLAAAIVGGCSSSSRPQGGAQDAAGGSPVFEQFWWDHRYFCAPSDPGPCRYKVEVDSAGQVTDTRGSVITTFPVSADELAQIQADFTAPEVVSMFRTGCHPEIPLSDDQITMSLKLVGQDAMTIANASCPDSATTRIEHWVGALHARATADAGSP